MPSLTLTPHEYRRGLPAVCAKCGRPATGAVPRVLRIPPDQYTWAWALPVLVSLMLCPPLFFLTAVLIGERVEVRVPTCDDHRRDWVWRDRLTWWVLYPAWSLAVIGLVVFAVRDPALFCPLIPTTVVVLLAVAGTEFYVIGHGAVLLMGGERLEVKLRRTHPAFVEATEEERERERRENPARVFTYGDQRDDYDDEPVAGRTFPPARPDPSRDRDGDGQTERRRD